MQGAYATGQLSYHTLLRPTWKFLTFLPSSTPSYISLIHPTTSYTGLFIPPTPAYHNLHSISQPSYPVLPLPYSSSPRTLVACLLSNLIVPHHTLDCSSFLPNPTSSYHWIVQPATPSLPHCPSHTSLISKTTSLPLSSPPPSLSLQR